MEIDLLFSIFVKWYHCGNVGTNGTKGVTNGTIDNTIWVNVNANGTIGTDGTSLAFFYKIHSGTVSLDKDKYLTPAPNLQRTRASHDSQYTRYFAYSDALKNSFFPRTIPLWNSLPSSVVSSKSTEEFKGLI